uniref:Uncharacterized protein n=1 Tax=Timema bartmani TaxID=61472 RepID=A0A7R9F9U8_9NEOP|nr:unnamed protein product [Timema bartmani]
MTLEQTNLAQDLGLAHQFSPWVANWRALTCQAKGLGFELRVQVTPDRDSNLDLPVIGNPAYRKSSALDHAATEALAW